MKNLRVLLVTALLSLHSFSAQAQYQVPSHSVPVGRGGGNQGFSNAPPGAAGNVLTSNGASADPTFKASTGGGGGGNVTYVDNGTGACTATGLGIVDDAAAIRACMVQIAAAGGGVAGLSCDRTYLLGSKDANSVLLTPVPTVSIRGCGPSSVLKVADNMNTGGTQFYVIFAGAAIVMNNWTVERFTLDFNGVNNSCGGTCYYNNIGVGVTNGSNIVVDSVTFLNNPGSQNIAINGLNGVGSVSGVRISNNIHNGACTIVNAACTDHSSMFVAANGYVITNNICRNTVQAIHSTCWEQWGDTGTAYGNTVDNYTKVANIAAIVFGGSTRNQVMIGNVARNMISGVTLWCDGIGASTLSEIRIEGNSFIQNTLSGPFIDFGQAVSADCSKNLYYMNNTFQSTVAAGLVSSPETFTLGRGANQVISGNTFQGGSGPAISHATFSALTSFQIFDNSFIDVAQTVTAGARRGILIRSAVAISRIEISRNQFQNVAATYMQYAMDITNGAGGNFAANGGGWIANDNIIVNMATAAVNLLLGGNIVTNPIAGVAYIRGPGQPYGATAQLLDGQVLLGVTAGGPQGGTMSGACTITNTGATSCISKTNIFFGTSFGACGAVPQNATNFIGLPFCWNPTETNMQVPFSRAAVLSNLQIKTTVAPAAGQTYTVNLRKNGAATGAPGNVSCVIANPATTCTDVTNVASYAAGDLFDLQFVSSVTAGATNAVTGAITSTATTP